MSNKQRTAAQIAAMQRELQKLKDAATESAKREREATARTREQSRRQSAIEQLGKHGMDPFRAKQALAWLDSEGMVRYESDQSDRLVFGKQIEGQIPDELDAGVATWVKSDEGKTFLPPTNAKGSGDRGGALAPNSAGTDLRTQASEGLRHVFGGGGGGAPSGGAGTDQRSLAAEGLLRVFSGDLTKG